MSWLLGGFCFLLGFFIATIALTIYDAVKLGAGQPMRE